MTGYLTLHVHDLCFSFSWTLFTVTTNKSKLLTTLALTKSSIPFLITKWTIQRLLQQSKKTNHQARSYFFRYFVYSVETVLS